MMTFCLIRLGKDSTNEIEKIDTLRGIQDPPLNIRIKCKQVPSEINKSAFAFIWLGSDNNKGAPTKWDQGLRAFGIIISKKGGPGYNDEWVITLNINFVLFKSIKAVDIIEKSGANYVKISDIPVIGLNTHSNQTVQLIKISEPNQDVKSLFDLLDLVEPGFTNNVIAQFPDLDSVLLLRSVSHENAHHQYDIGSDVVTTADENISQYDVSSSEPAQIVEAEDVGSGALMQKPFDPKLIDIKQKNLSVDLLIKRLEAKPQPEIDLYPDFQRKDDLWDEKKQSQLIESILISFPLPAFYFDGTNDSKWLVVDGLQRLSALRNFMVNKKLRLTGLEFLHQLIGKSYDELPRTLQRQIEEAQIVAYIINPGTPDEVKFNIFKRINTGGLVLEPQEIRHAINQGVPAKFIAELANTIEFKEATGYKIRTERMLDREFITRFVTFYIRPFSEYKPDLDTYMSQKMSELKTLNDSQLAKIKHDFTESMKASIGIFKKWTFRKVFNVNDKLKPINKALFEVWSVCLANLTDDERKTVLLKQKKLFGEFMNVMNSDSKFIEAITSTTGDKTRVTYRFTVIEELLKKLLQS